MTKGSVPRVFAQLLREGCIADGDILKTEDGFWLLYRSLADILAQKEIVDFPTEAGERLFCSSFYDDWFLYAVPHQGDYTYSLLKMREQEHDARDGGFADGDTPGVTVSFVSFCCDMLLACLTDSSDQNRLVLDREINRVVAYRGQRHHKGLKRYFIDPRSEGAYLVASVYVKQIACCADEDSFSVPLYYKEILRRSRAHPKSAKLARLPQFIDSVNRKAGYVICDHEKIHLKDRSALTADEAAVILATHTGNTSIYSFAAEVEYHARFLTPLAKIRIPFLGRSVYDSAIRADMTVGDTEFEGPAPFYRSGSAIVKRHRKLHRADF